MIVDNGRGCEWSMPGMLSDRVFIMAHARKLGDPKAHIVLYEFDESNALLRPRKLRTFQLPVMRENLTIEAIHVVSRTMTPTYTGLEARLESLASHSIYSDHEQLCATVIVLPLEDDFARYYKILAYPSTFLSSRYEGMRNVPWESWGAKHAACFSYNTGPSATIAQYYQRGDRVVVVDRTGRLDDSLYTWSLRILDFRSARVRRAQLVSKGHPVWPAPPHGSRKPVVKRVQEIGDHHGVEWYAFEEDPIHCDLPYIETRMREEFVGTNVVIAMDNERIILNKVR